jgi:hypothetical protein
LPIEELLADLWYSLSNLIPKILGAAIILIIGWIAGQLLAKGIASIIRRGRVEETFSKTVFGKALERSGITLSTFFNLLIKWLVYLIALLCAIDILGIKVLGTFMNFVIEYLPSLIGGILIFVIGIIAADFIGNVFSNVLREAKIFYANVFSVSLRLLLYFIVTIIALTVMKIDISILHIFANALAWGLAIGAAVGLGIALGWGLKDTVAKNAEGWLKAARSSLESVEEATVIESLKGRVKELEASLNAYKEKLEAMEKARKARMEELMAPIPDLDSRLVEMVGEAGRVSAVYGGYEIEVFDPVTFPWFVALILFNNGFDVWLSKRGDKPIIHCKPREL